MRWHHIGGVAPTDPARLSEANAFATLPAMFTGIVEELGTVRDIRAQHGEWGPGIRLLIDASTVLQGSELGASIAVNGCCLTLVEQGDGWWATDVSDETLSRTNIGGLAIGAPVNLERPMALGDRLGGHIVLGHVDTTGTIVQPAPDLVVRIPAASMRYVVEKGSVTVDGISLTAFDLVDEGDTGTFRVAVIPHTAEVTTLGSRQPGDPVNIETDVLAKHIERLVEPYR
jgi:riboflavin synthase